MTYKASNMQVQESVAKMVVERLTRQPFERSKIDIGPLAVNHFSFVFLLKIYTDSECHSVYVKIPKEDLRKKSKTILPFNRNELQMAEKEKESLEFLSSCWQSEDIGISWVKLLDYIPEYNAIVTKSADAPDAFEILRRLELSGRLGAKNNRYMLRDIMARIGLALGRFHGVHLKKSFFDFEAVVPKLKRYCRELKSMTHLPISRSHLSKIE